MKEEQQTEMSELLKDESQKSAGDEELASKVPDGNAKKRTPGLLFRPLLDPNKEIVIKPTNRRLSYSQSWERERERKQGYITTKCNAAHG